MSNVTIKGGSLEAQISEMLSASEAVVRAVNGALEFAGDILNEGLEGYAE